MLWAEGIEDRFIVGAKGFSLLHCLQTGSVLTHLPIQWLLRAISLGLKRWVKADQSPPSNEEIKNGRAIPPLLVRSHNVVLN
jgi:hypothetical protein